MNKQEQEAVERVIEAVRDGHTTFDSVGVTIRDVSIGDIRQFIADYERRGEALRHYADSKCWITEDKATYHQVNLGERRMILNDGSDNGYDIASTALAETGGE